jgi:hypothetical protein
VRDLMTAFIAAIIVALLSVSAYGESAATSAGPPSPGNPSQLFDPTRGVLLQGAQGRGNVRRIGKVKELGSELIRH